MSTRVVVLADTHLRAGSARSLPPAATDLLATANVILHAGDVVCAAFLDELAALAPLHAVLGNNDHGLETRLAPVLEIEIGGVAIAMIHNSGAAEGRERRMARRFPQAQLVVFGHSHMPLDELGVGGQRLFNPGSPTERRRAPHHSVGVLDLGEGRIQQHQIVTV